MAEVFFIAFGAGDIFFGFFSGFFRLFIGLPAFFDFFRRRFIIAERIKNIPVVGRIEQALIVKLSVNFHQISADFFQKPGTDRLVVNENFAFAVTVQRPFNQQFVRCFDFIFVKQYSQFLIFRRELKNCRNAEFISPLPYH